MESSPKTAKSIGGRPKSGIQVFFDYDDEVNKATCTITGCTYSSHIHSGNQARHMKSAHPDVYRVFIAEHQKENSKAASNNGTIKKNELRVLNRVNLSKSILQTAILELITVNGRPFSIFEDSGMRMILNPILECLPHDEKISLLPENIKLYVYDEADRIRKVIANEVKEKKLISLKVDVASRYGRSFLGLNIQFINNGKITIRTLGVVEITEKHTSENLKKKILSVFEKYNISMKNIFSFTSDNAANMIKLHNLLETCEEVSHDSKTIGTAETECDEEMVEDENMTFDEDDIEEAADDQRNVEDDVMKELNNYFSNDCSKIANIHCAAHTLQLAVDDGIKMSNVNKLIAKARMAVKYFRKDSFMNTLKDVQPPLSKPVLDVVTRWHSTYDMLASLLNFKQYRAHVKYLSEKDWQDIAVYVEVLKPAKIAAKKFQNEQLIMPEFYSTWLYCKETIQKLDIPFAHNIVQCMEKREEKIGENEVLLGAIFLDPLLNCLLMEDKNRVAMICLVELWNKLQNLISNTEQMEESLNMSQLEDEHDEDDQMSTMPSSVREALHKKKKPRWRSHRQSTSCQCFIDFTTMKKETKKKIYYNFGSEKSSSILSCIK